jgi:hypothetical protein
MQINLSKDQTMPGLFRVRAGNRKVVISLSKLDTMIGKVPSDDDCRKLVEQDLRPAGASEQVQPVGAPGTGHTPETWHAASTGNHQGLIISDKDGRNVAVCYRKEDAPLIAGAPELLAACASLLDAADGLNALYDDDSRAQAYAHELNALAEAKDTVRAAIAKAKGRQ